MPTVDELSSPDYELLGELTHTRLIDFVVGHFFRRPTWLTRLHHTMSLATIAAIAAVVIAQQHGVLRCLGDLLLALVALFLLILPLHESLHAVAYRLAGARDIRWDYSLRTAAAWVIAHRFVATPRPFVFVALAPFVVINPVLIAAAFRWPQHALLFLFALLWHLQGSIGDWSLLNFIWLHRRRGFWTFDDAEIGKSYFFGRAGNV